MEHNQPVHRCINAGCGRAFPRQVGFCPWCGTAQRPAAPVPPVLPVPPVPPVLAKPPSPAAAPAQPTPTAASASGAGVASAQTAGSPRPSVPPPPPPPPRPPTSAPSRPGATPRPAAPARKPIRLRWWLLALGALWLAWMLTKPLDARIERRMGTAIALAKECKPKPAQDELIALRKTRASATQLGKVQEALNAAAAACSRAEQRAAAWGDTNDAVERLLHASSFDKARSRLSSFTKRWGADQHTRELGKRIDAGRRDHPLADPRRGG